VEPYANPTMYKCKGVFMFTESNKAVLSPQQRYHKLANASSEYMSGKISLDELRRKERTYGTDYGAIVSGMLRIRVSSKIGDLIKQYTK
jgi:hypothetical protein